MGLKYLPTLSHEFKPNVGKHTSPMEHMANLTSTPTATVPRSHSPGRSRSRSRSSRSHRRRRSSRKQVSDAWWKS